MAFTYDPVLTTDRDKLRRLINDVVEPAIFADAEVDGFLSMTTSYLRGAAMALRVIAANDAYVMKVMTRGDLTTNGKATAEGILLAARALDEQADAIDAADEEGGFEIAEMVVDDFSWRERIWNQALRGAV